MIDLISFLSILIVNALMKRSEAYPEMVNSYISIALMFSVLVNFFIMILKDKVPSAKKRYSMMCVLYIVLMLDCILATFYFSYYLMDIAWFKWFVRIFIYATFFVSLGMTKYFEIKLKRNLGKTYFKFVILEGILLLALSLIDILETTKSMILHSWTITAVIVLFGILSAINLLRNWFEPYWYHKNILMMRLINLADQHIMNKAVIPPQREIESDAILREVKYVLERSFIRPLEVNRLTKQLYDLMIEKGYDKNVAVNYCAMWSQTMICNLMKRKDDFNYMPNFIRMWLSKFSKYKGNNKRR